MNTVTDLPWPLDLPEACAWHPVIEAAALAGEPVAVRLLGHALVAWRDADGEARVWSDRCPHRGAQLSLGQVVDGCLQCPYHGWQFDACGQCVQVPALPDFNPPASHHAQVHETREAHGLVWVRLGSVDGPVPLPAFAAEADTRLRKVLCGPYDVETSAPRIVENFLDMAHFSFVHEGWLGAREHPVIAPYAVAATAEGLLATDCQAWQPRSNLHAEDGAHVAYTYEVVGPYTAVLTKKPDPAPPAHPDLREAIALFICPIGPESSRVWFRMAMNDFQSTDDAIRAFQHTIFTQDAPILLSQRPRRLPLSDQAPVKELHCAADRSSAAYRRHLRERGITFGTC